MLSTSCLKHRTWRAVPGAALFSKAEGKASGQPGPKWPTGQPRRHLEKSRVTTETADTVWRWGRLMLQRKLFCKRFCTSRQLVVLLKASQNWNCSTFYQLTAGDRRETVLEGLQPLHRAPACLLSRGKRTKSHRHPPAENSPPPPSPVLPSGRWEH